LRSIHDWKIDVVMPRSILASLPVLLADFLWKTKIVYHSDGLAADEKIDNENVSPRSLSYRVLRLIESQIVQRSSATLSLTKFGEDILISRSGLKQTPGKFLLVRNGKELQTSSSSFLNPRSGPTGNKRPLRPFTLCYLGSWGIQYDPSKMLEFSMYLKAEIPGLEFCIFTGDFLSARQYVSSRCEALDEWIFIKQLAPSEINFTLGECDLGISFRRPTLSSRAVSPVKVGDYLLAGIPVIGDLTGDFAQELADRGVLFPLQNLGPKAALRWIREEVVNNRLAMKERCHLVGEDNFGIRQTAADYNRALSFAVAGGV